MMSGETKTPKQPDAEKGGLMEAQWEILRLGVAGYKSISREQAVEIAPLTLFAGANSSGKSSMMQPLLLLKQTLEASFDPGPLLLDGPNLKFRSVDEFLSRNGKPTHRLEVALGLELAMSAKLQFRRRPGNGLELQQTVYRDRDGELTLSPGMKPEELVPKLPVAWQHLPEVFRKKAKQIEWRVSRNRCFFDLEFTARDEGVATRIPVVKAGAFADAIRHVIHLPALRGNPERAYPIAAVGASFPGSFDAYTASVIAQWQAGEEREKLRQLDDDLQKLGLTCRVAAKRLDDAQVELQVGRLPHVAKGGTHDLVNLADVGFGVSQALPVLVALQAAVAGQLVYVEQPELHLHPRAQLALAEVLAQAANKGVKVVAETHSELLLLGVQTLVAQGKLSPDLVKLYWFQRGDDGASRVSSANLDNAGAFGDWPEDFSEVTLQAERRFLDAAEARLRKR
jgi:hypothetical protein